MLTVRDTIANLQDEKEGVVALIISLAVYERRKLYAWMISKTGHEMMEITIVTYYG